MVAGPRINIGINTGSHGLWNKSSVLKSNGGLNEIMETFDLMCLFMEQIYLHICTRNADFSFLFLSVQLEFVNIYLNYLNSSLLFYIRNI